VTAAVAVAVAIFLCAGGANGRWIELDPSHTSEPSLRVLESSGASTVIEVRVPRIWVDDVEIDGETFQRLKLPEAGVSSAGIGEPELPVYSRWLEIPSASSATAELLSEDFVELEGYKVYPAQRPLPEIVSSPDEFAVDRSVYSKDAYMSEQRAEAGTPSLFRNLRVAQISVRPVQFNPATGRIRISTRAVVRIDFTGHSTENIPRRTDTATRAFGALQEAFLLDYVPLYTSPGSYLIITADTFRTAVEPLAEWKNRKGLRTVVTELSEIPPGDSAAIHNHIKDAYDSWEVPPEYVLLVGDVEFLPTGMHEGIYPPPWGEYYYFGTDHCFSLVAGNDVLPDVFVARLPVNSAEECSTVVAKILDYETAPYMISTDWFEEAATAGVYQPGRIFQPTCRTVRTIMLTGGYGQVDTLFEGTSPPGFATPEDISDSLNDGRTFLMFRGHGSQDGWWTDDSYNILATEHVDTLKNGRETPVVIAPTCLANAYFDEAQDCMGESFVLQDQGSVGYFGATDVSYSFWNDSLAIGIFRGIFEEGSYHLQQACNYGKLYMEKYFPLNDPGNGEITEQEFFFMNTLGDPELPLWTDTPKPLLAIHVDTVGVGSRLLSVLVESESTPVGNALVCIMKNPESYASGFTDGSGLVTLPATPLTEGQMEVTATAENCLPYSGNIVVVAAPLTPELMSPPDLAVLADSLPLFVWSRTASDSGHYEFGLAEDSTFTIGAFSADSLLDTTFALVTGLADGVYYWRVRAFDEKGMDSGFQLHPFSFMVDCTPPVFSNTTVIPDTAGEGPFEIYSMITDISGVLSSTLYYRASPDTLWTAVPMDSAGAPDSFHAEIPQQISGVTVDYYLDASDLSSPSNWGVDPAGAPSVYYSFQILSVGIAEDLTRMRIPFSFSLSTPSPSPFAVESSVFLGIPQSSRVEVAIYDAAGRRVKSLVDRVLLPGYHRASWDGTDSHGERVNAGVYFYTMQTSSYRSSKKVLLLR
jgi:hypothetical protein